MMDKQKAIRLSKYRSIITNHDKILSKVLTPENLKKILCSFKRGIGSYPNIFIYLILRYDDSESYQESLYRIIHNIDIRPTCQSCGGHVNFKNTRDGFRRFCSTRCSSNDNTVKEKSKKTCLDKYGVEYVGQSYDVKEKIKNSFIDHYGVDNCFKNDEVRKRIRNTLEEKYGYSYVGQIPRASTKRQKLNKPKKVIDIGSTSSIQEFDLIRYKIDNAKRNHNHESQ